MSNYEITIKKSGDDTRIIIVAWGERRVRDGADSAGIKHYAFQHETLGASLAHLSEVLKKCESRTVHFQPKDLNG